MRGDHRSASLECSEGEVFPPPATSATHTRRGQPSRTSGPCSGRGCSGRAGGGGGGGRRLQTRAIAPAPAHFPFGSGPRAQPPSKPHPHWALLVTSIRRARAVLGRWRVKGAARVGSGVRLDRSRPLDPGPRESAALSQRRRGGVLPTEGQGRGLTPEAPSADEFFSRSTPFRLSRLAVLMAQLNNSSIRSYINKCLLRVTFQACSSSGDAARDRITNVFVFFV